MTQNQKNKIRAFIIEDPDILRGKPVFKGTRVPVSLVMQYISNGLSIPQINKSFPTVKVKYISKLIDILSEEFNSNEKDAKRDYSLG